MKLKPEKNGWHNLAYLDNKTNEKKTIKLKQGINQIIFSCEVPNIPEIEFVRLSKNIEKSIISEEKYVHFIDEIEQNDNVEKKDSIKNDTLGITLKSATLLDEINYYYHLDVNFQYTFYTTRALTQGDQFQIWSGSMSSSNYVLEIFSASNPESYTYTINSSNGNAQYAMNIPYSDIYYIKIRSRNVGTSLTVDLSITVNGSPTYYDEMPVTFCGFRHPHDTPTTYNYFTCNLTGDSRI